MSRIIVDFKRENLIVLVDLRSQVFVVVFCLFTYVGQWSSSDFADVGSEDPHWRERTIIIKMLQMGYSYISILIIHNQQFGQTPVIVVHRNNSSIH